MHKLSHASFRVWNALVCRRRGAMSAYTCVQVLDVSFHVIAMIDYGDRCKDARTMIDHGGDG